MVFFPYFSTVFGFGDLLPQNWYVMREYWHLDHAHGLPWQSINADWGCDVPSNFTPRSCQAEY
jgi:hypothetical protein